MDRNSSNGIGDRYENCLKALRDQRSFEYERDKAVQARDEAQPPLTDAQREVKQELVRRIQLAQRLLGHSRASHDQLLSQPLHQLRTLADELEKQLLA